MTAAVDDAGVPLFVAGLLDPSEIIIGVWRPALWYLPLRSGRVVVVVVLAASAAAAAAGAAGLEWGPAIVQVATLLIAARIAWVAADWASRMYILTDRRVIRRRGVVNPSVYQMHLQRIRRIDLVQSAPARCVGTGTITFSTRADGPSDAAWVLVPRAAEVQALIVETRRRYGK